MLLPLPLLTASLLLSSVANANANADADDTTYTILHRAFGPGVEEQNFVPRAYLDLNTFRLIPIEGDGITNDLQRVYDSAHHLDSALYQLALLGPDHAHDPHRERLDISSVKACHLPLALAERLTFHLDTDGKPYHMEYYLDGPPPTGAGACPSTKHLRATGDIPLHRSNVTVGLRTASTPPLPELRVPPPLSPKGQPIPPPPEKSFLQKNWMYLALALVVMLFAGGAPPEEEGGQQPARSR